MIELLYDAIRVALNESGTTITAIFKDSNGRKIHFIRYSNCWHSLYVRNILSFGEEQIMNKCINGKIIEMTPEEIAAMNETLSELQPTEEERIAALEAAILELGEAIANG